MLMLFLQITWSSFSAPKKKKKKKAKSIKFIFSRYSETPKFQAAGRKAGRDGGADKAQSKKNKLEKLNTSPVYLILSIYKYCSSSRYLSSIYVK